MSDLQSVPPVEDAELERLLDGFDLAARRDASRRSGDYDAARAALVSYVTRKTLTRDEALFLYGIPAHPGCTPEVEERRDKIVERFLNVADSAIQERPQDG